MLQIGHALISNMAAAHWHCSWLNWITLNLAPLAPALPNKEDVEVTLVFD